MSDEPGRPTKKGLAILLIVGGFACAIHLPDLGHAYLPGWDEAIHAQVAASLSEHPLTPTLFDQPFIHYDSHNWQANHVWLHMPPMPFWQAALGVAVGGRSLFWLRLPGLLLFLATLAGIYWLGLRLYSERAGLLGVVLYAGAPFGWLQVQGYHFGDMTDVGLAFWLTACAVAVERALATGRLRWMALAGLAQGAALLSKSALALAPMGACLVVWLAPKIRLRLRAAPRWLLPAFHLGLGLGMWWAWRIYASVRWPAEWAHETHAQWLHVTTAYEGHGRPADALFNDLLANLFTPAFVLLALAAAVFAAWRAWKDRRAPVAFHGLWILGTWLPLLVVQTKVPAVLFGMAPALAVGIGALVIHLAGPRPGPWRAALVLAPALALLVGPLLPKEWFAFAKGWLPDLAAVPHLPLQLAALVALGGVLFGLAWLLRRRSPPDWLRTLAQLAVVVGLVVPFASMLIQQRSTRLGFQIIADYNPIARTCERLGPKLPEEARLIIEGNTNGRQRPDLAAAFFTGRPAHLVSGSGLENARRRAAESGPPVLLTPIQRQAEPLLTPQPGDGWWAYRADAAVPTPELADPDAPAPVATFPKGPDLVRLVPAATSVPAGSALPILAVWRAKGPAFHHATQPVLEPVNGGAPLKPWPLPEDFPEGLSAVHLHNLSPPGLLWGFRPFGTALGEPHRWRAGYVVADDFFIWIPEHIEPGRYRLVQRMLVRGRPEAPVGAVAWPVVEVLAP